jgi:N-acetylmuramoyl-L-alanine amidase
MRPIKYIVVHCTATQQNVTVAAIERYWKDNLKWKSPGYHVIVKADGIAVRLAPDETVCNGVAGYNSISLHLSYIGGVDSKGSPMDNRTAKQKETMLKIITDWKQKYPNAIIQGHRDFPKVSKACPSFFAKTEYKDI